MTSLDAGRVVVILTTISNERKTTTLCSTMNANLLLHDFQSLAVTEWSR